MRLRSTHRFLATFATALMLGYVSIRPCATENLAPTPAQQARPAFTPHNPTKRCCFCIYPMPGARDSDKFHHMCQRCLPVKFPNCDVYESFPSSDFMPEYIERHNCGPRISVLNNQHGPDISQAANIFAVCQSAYPGCSANILDTTCETYESQSKAEEAVQHYKSIMPPGAKVEICGSGSIHLWQGCDSYRIVKKYVISPTVTEERLGICPPFGSPCSFSHDGSQSFECLDTLGRKQTIPCCKSSKEVGYWGGSHGCAGRGCSKTSCPTIERCVGNTLELHYCSEESRTGVCIKNSADCEIYAKECRQVDDTVACVPRAVPTVSR